MRKVAWWRSNANASYALPAIRKRHRLSVDAPDAWRGLQLIAETIELEKGQQDPVATELESNQPCANRTHSTA